MELQPKIAQISKDVNEIRNLDKLSEYQSKLSDELKDDIDVKRIIKSRRMKINIFLRLLDPNNCSSCGMLLGTDDYDRPICYMCRF